MRQPSTTTSNQSFFYPKCEIRRRDTSKLALRKSCIKGRYRISVPLRAPCSSHKRVLSFIKNAKKIDILG